MAEMQKRTDIWQVEGNLVYKLQYTGTYRQGERILSNEFSFLVQGTSLKSASQAADALKRNLLAEEICKALNDAGVDGEKKSVDLTDELFYRLWALCSSTEHHDKEAWLSIEKQLRSVGVLGNATGQNPAYGYCPHCGEPGTAREKRPNGNDTCEGGHVYPSSAAVDENGEGD